MSARPFDLHDPLPEARTTLVEASAGTGKTYTITGLAVRRVAEHADPLSSLLLVTFTRAATAELRARVRSSLVAAEAHLARPRSDLPVEDPVLAALDDADDRERAVRRGRLATAIAEFDTAGISTIHGFCSQVRVAMGVLSAEGVDAAPTENEAALIRQVCADRYFQVLSSCDGESPLGSRKLDQLVEYVTRARTLVDCEIRAASEGPGLAVADFVRQATAEVDDRLQSEGRVSFDSVLRSVRDGLRARPGLVGELRQRYRVAMVDEFQDTDPVQWEIFRTVFHEPAADGSRPTLVLVGDPKQAIFSFRGGDVYTYLAAAEVAEPRSLATNHRSDRAVVEAMNALAAGQRYGESGIDYLPVDVASRNERRMATTGGQPAAGIEVRVRPDDGAGSADARRHIAADLAAVVADRLHRTRIVDPDTGGERRVAARDFAVLVGSASHGHGVVTALRRARIPAVLRLRDDVGDSPARDQWRTLLYALDRPAVTSRAAAAALTWFIGWSPSRLAEALEAEGGEAADDLVALQLDLAAWSDRLTERGLAAVLGELRRAGLVERLLREPDGERNLTDLEHLADLIQAEAGARGRGLTAGSALAVLDSLGGTPDDELAADAAQRRIDSDADAVQVMTIHAAKGLEFPFVLLPTLWAGGRRTQAVIPYSFAESGTRVLDLTMEKPANPATGPRRSPADLAPKSREATLRQNCGDQHRLTYVALTRAVHQTVVWWTRPKGSGGELTGLARLLFGGGDEAADQKVTIPGDWVSGIRDRVDAVGAAPWVDVVEMGPRPDLDRIEVPPSGPAADGPPEAHVAATLGRSLPRDGRVWSFTALAPEHAAAGVTADPTVDAAADVAAADEAPDEIPVTPEPLVPGGSAAAPSAASRFAGLGGGAELGNVVHHVFEHLDFTAGDPEAAAAEVLAAPMPYAVSADQRAGLPAAIAAAIRTPLPDALGGSPLASVARSDRLDEMRFDLPLAPGSGFPAAAIGELVRGHLPDGDPLRPWADQLARGLGTEPLRGLLTGSIDLVLRHGRGYSVVDYKTNQLAAGGDTGLDAYRPDRLVAAMASHHYPLQALLYSVALHRYLRWRLPGYDPAVHLGAVGYLFVRGMVGPDTPVHDGEVAGVFTWDVPTKLVIELSALIAGERP